MKGFAQMKKKTPIPSNQRDFIFFYNGMHNGDCRVQLLSCHRFQEGFFQRAYGR